MVLAGMMVLLECSASCSNFFLVMSNADGTGIEVNNAVTSYDVMHSPSSNLIFFISSANCLELLT